MAVSHKKRLEPRARCSAEPSPHPARRILDELQRRAPHELRGHHHRVGAMSARLARRLGLAEHEVAEIARAGALHDIGMVLLPDELLGRRGWFDRQERALVRRHSAWAEEILTMTKEPALQVAARVALEHHERWDGSGYPQGLKGEQICLPARIVAICAVYDALRRPRPGREPRDHQAALSVLCDGDSQSGPDAFDPAVRDVFVRHQEDFRRLSEGEFVRPSRQRMET